CVEGDYGAPLEVEELAILKDIYPRIKSYLTPKGIKTIEEEGTHVVDPEGDYATPVIKGRECAYARYDEKGILKCGIEEAHQDGVISFRKPISCRRSSASAARCSCGRTRRTRCASSAPTSTS